MSLQQQCFVHSQIRSKKQDIKIMNTEQLLEMTKTENKSGWN